MFLRFFKSYQKAAHPHPIKKKKISEWGRASPTPVRLLPAARPPSRSPPDSALLRPEFSIPWIAGSRGRGEEDRGKVWERDGFGAFGGGRGNSPATRILLKGPRSSSLSLLPRFPSLPRTFPGQLGLKFSGEAAPSPWDKGRPGSAQDPSGPPPRLPRLAAGRVTPRGGGGGSGAAEPGAGGEQGPAWDPSSAPTGGRGGAAACPERCNPPLASGGAAQAGRAVGKASPRDP